MRVWNLLFGGWFQTSTSLHHAFLQHCMLRLCLAVSTAKFVPQCHLQLQVSDTARPQQTRELQCIIAYINSASNSSTIKVSLYFLQVTLMRTERELTLPSVTLLRHISLLEVIFFSLQTNLLSVLPWHSPSCWEHLFHVGTHREITNAISIKWLVYWARTAIISEAASLWTSVVNEKPLKGVQQHMEKLYKTWGLSSACATLALYIQKKLPFRDL